MGFVNKYFFPFFLLFIIFAEMIFRVYMIAAGIAVGSGQIQMMYIGTFLVALMLCIYDMLNRKLWMKTRRVFVFLLFVCLSLFITQFFYPGSPSQNYRTSFLYYGAVCIPAAIVGIHLARKDCMKYVDRLLPFFIIPLGLVIGTAGVAATQAQGMISQTDESGLDYQNISYYFALLYALSAYFVFFSSLRGSKALKCLMLAFMFFFAIMCLYSGGRGAMVFIVVVSCFIIYTLIKANKKRKPLIIAVIVILGITFALISSEMGVWESAGFTRVSENIGQDDERIRLKNVAIKVFLDSPIWGHGIGSVWWEVGYYTHNIILDFLVEMGLIGTLLGCYILWLMIKRTYLLCKVDKSYLFVMIILIESLVHGTFSGYWVNTQNIWMVFGLIFSLPVSFFYGKLSAIKQ